MSVTAAEPITVPLSRRRQQLRSRRRVPELRLRRGNSLRPVLYAFVPPGALLALAVMLRLAGGVPVGTLTRDRWHFVGGPFYAGVYSTLGLLLWACAAAICFFVVSLISVRHSRVGRMFLYGGVLSTLLLADDMLMLHELVLPRHFGVAEPIVMTVLAVTAVCFVVLSRRELLTGPLVLFVLTAVFFASSVISDMLPVRRGQLLIEDGLKLLGICGWLGFWLQRAATELGPPPSP